MKKPATIKEKIDRRLDQLAEAHRRGGLLRETALLKFRWVPNIRKLVQYFAEALYQGAGAKPLDPGLLGESVVRAKLRAAGAELRAIQDWVGEVSTEPRRAGADGAALDPADRQLCEWAAEQRREVMRLAVRFERRVGPPPKEAGA